MSKIFGRAHGYHATAMAFETPQGDMVLSQYPAAFHDTPARGLEGGINVLGSGFGFVHG
jgi:hypothetical protein